MKTVKTSKGTELPLTNLKGKDYLMVAYRLQWLSEDIEHYDITTELLSVTDEQTVAKATVVLFKKDGTMSRKAQATKRETKKDFSDHTEKAETAAIGRALAMLGFGTQHALSDLDEGQRIVDSPLQQVKLSTQQTTEDISNVSVSSNVTSISEPPKSRTTFRQKPKTETTEEQTKGLNF